MSTELTVTGGEVSSTGDAVFHGRFGLFTISGSNVVFWPTAFDPTPSPSRFYASSHTAVYETAGGKQRGWVTARHTSGHNFTSSTRDMLWNSVSGSDYGSYNASTGEFTLDANKLWHITVHLSVFAFTTSATFEIVDGSNNAVDSTIIQAESINNGAGHTFGNQSSCTTVVSTYGGANQVFKLRMTASTDTSFNSRSGASMVIREI